MELNPEHDGEKSANCGLSPVEFGVEIPPSDLSPDFGPNLASY